MSNLLQSMSDLQKKSVLAFYNMIINSDGEKQNYERFYVNILCEILDIDYELKEWVLGSKIVSELEKLDEDVLEEVLMNLFDFIKEKDSMEYYIVEQIAEKLEIDLDYYYEKYEDIENEYLSLFSKAILVNLLYKLANIDDDFTEEEMDEINRIKSDFNIDVTPKFNNIEMVIYFINQMKTPQKVKMFRYLFDLALADGHMSEVELDYITKLANECDIDASVIQKEYVSVTSKKKQEVSRSMTSTKQSNNGYTIPEDPYSYTPLDVEVCDNYILRFQKEGDTYIALHPIPLTQFNNSVIRVHIHVMFEGLDEQINEFDMIDLFEGTNGMPIRGSHNGMSFGIVQVGACWYASMEGYARTAKGKKTFQFTLISPDIRENNIECVMDIHNVVKYEGENLYHVTFMIEKDNRYSDTPYDYLYTCKKCNEHTIIPFIIEEIPDEDEYWDVKHKYTIGEGRNKQVIIVDFEEAHDDLDVTLKCEHCNTKRTINFNSMREMYYRVDHRGGKFSFLINDKFDWKLLEDEDYMVTKEDIELIDFNTIEDNVILYFTNRVLQQDPNMIKYLLKEYNVFDLKLETVMGEFAYPFTFVYNDNVSILKAMLEHGLDVDIKRDETSASTMLIAATDQRKVEIIKLLLEFNADKSYRNEFGLCAADFVETDDKLFKLVSPDEEYTSEKDNSKLDMEEDFENIQKSIETSFNDLQEDLVNVDKEDLSNYLDDLEVFTSTILNWAVTTKKKQEEFDFSYDETFIEKIELVIPKESNVVEKHPIGFEILDMFGEVGLQLVKMLMMIDMVFDPAMIGGEKFEQMTMYLERVLNGFEFVCNETLQQINKIKKLL